MPLPVLPLVAGGYVIASGTLLAFPQLLHRRLGGRMMRHGSHRGGAGEATENTLPAFRNAVVRGGSELLELDVHLTADQQVVVAHDAELSRMCGVAQRIADTNYADLPRYLPASQLRLPPPFHGPSTTLADEAGAHPEAERGQPDADVRRIPLLSEVFDEFPDTFVNIDLKGADPDGVMLEKVHSLIVAKGREALTCWGSFNDKTVQACYATNPDIPVMFSARRTFVLLGLFYSGLLPFVPIKETYLEIPLLTKSDIQKAAAHGYSADGPGLRQAAIRGAVTAAGWLLRSRVLFSHLEKRGCTTQVWTYNSDAEFREAFEVGATGIMTDFPTRLRTYLDAERVHSGGRGAAAATQQHHRM
eukprot:COSAG02_NODE_5814_length_4019_cov_2.276786_2_plen_360_part_00